MRIEDLESKKRLNILGLCLTRAEAMDLRDVLSTLLGADKDRHEHVASVDYQTELTIWIDDDQ